MLTRSSVRGCPSKPVKGVLKWLGHTNGNQVSERDIVLAITIRRYFKFCSDQSQNLILLRKPRFCKISSAGRYGKNILLR